VTFSLLPRPKNAVMFQRLPPDSPRQQHHPSRKPPRDQHHNAASSHQ
jgi:hypothetical protein